MKINSISVREIQIPFVTSFKHSLSTRNATESVVVEITTDEGIRGYGEGAPREYVTGETLNSTISSLKNVALKISNIVSEGIGNLSDKNDSIELLRTIPEDIKDLGPSAKCALELALFDVYSRSHRLPVLDLFGKQLTDTIHYSCAISEGSISSTKRLLEKIKPFGFKQLKLKVGSDIQSDMERIKMVRSVLGETVEIRIDANGAWSFEEAVKNIYRYYENGIRIAEQPLPVRLKWEYPLLFKEVDPEIIIVIDESLCRIEDAMWFIENSGASAFNLKISKHGGLLNTLEIYQLAQKSGILCQLGCHVGETSILSAAGRTFAALTDRLFAYEGAYGTHLLSYDIDAASIKFGNQGELSLSDIRNNEGIGINIDPNLLEKATSKEYRFL
jgi:L-alanine-DL-glutamate epimerase-like enolase superfamily enzyme